MDWSSFVNEEEEFELESSDYSEWDLVTQSKEESTCILLCICIPFYFIANEPAERRRSAGEAAENSAARRMAYAKKFSIEL